MTVPSTLNHAMQKSLEWLYELRDNGDLNDTNEALAVLRAVLHRLRDRLTLEEAVDLGCQLPLFVRGIYYEGWRPHKVPVKIDKLQKFMEEVMISLSPRTISAERAVRDVFAVLAHHCDPGEISDVIDQLPKELKELWPSPSQTFRERMHK